MNDRLPDDLMNLFRLNSNVHSTPQLLNSSIKNHIFIPSFNTVTYGKKSPKYQCAHLWNKHFKTGTIQVEANKNKDINVVKMSSAKTFKNTLKQHYLYSYTVEEPEFLFY